MVNNRVRFWVSLIFNCEWVVLALGQCCFSKLQDNFKISTHSTAKGRDQSHREEVRIGERKKEREKERKREWEKGKNSIIIIKNVRRLLIKRATLVSITYYNFIKYK